MNRLSVSYKGHKPTKDAKIRKIVGKREAGSGFHRLHQGTLEIMNVSP
jgi:hypothetical protein